MQYECEKCGFRTDELDEDVSRCPTCDIQMKEVEEVVNEEQMKEDAKELETEKKVKVNNWEIMKLLRRAKQYLREAVEEYGANKKDIQPLMDKIEELVINLPMD